MSYADKVFVQRCKEILLNGISDRPLEVRTKWPSDGVPAHTKKILYAQDSYDLRIDPIPTITLRKQYFKGAIDEILWIYQKQSNRLEDLNSHVWDSWDIGDGTIGKAYGYQIAKLSKHHKYQSIDYNELNSGFYGNFRVDAADGYVYLNQIGAVLWDLKHDPGSRRIMTNTYNHDDLKEMGLAPCAYSIMFNVTFVNGEKVLNAILFQRSQDMLTANGWNVMQYAALVQMIAQVVGMKPGRFDHLVSDMHVYDRHERVVSKMIDTYLAEGHSFLGMSGDGWEDLLAKDENGRTLLDRYIDEIPYDKPYPNPKLWINPDVKSFFDFTADDLKLTDYQYCYFNHKIGNGLDCDIEVAI